MTLLLNVPGNVRHYIRRERNKNVCCDYLIDMKVPQKPCLENASGVKMMRQIGSRGMLLIALQFNYICNVCYFSKLVSGFRVKRQYACFLETDGFFWCRKAQNHL